MSTQTPTSQVLERDQARDQALPHYFCYRCMPPVGESGQAVCGTLATRKGFTGHAPHACVVCRDLWEEFWTCPDCGWRNWASDE